VARLLPHIRALLNDAESASTFDQRRASEYALAAIGLGFLAEMIRDAAPVQLTPKMAEAPGLNIRPLTPRERNVVELAKAGLSNKEISRALFISVSTVEQHLRSAYRKLGIKRRGQLSYFV
jgi:DNA-binding CsgD family transcriptional regulator